MPDSQPSTQDAAAWPSPSAGWTAAGVLALASMVSQADRTVLSLMAGPVKEAFTLSDTAFSLLHSVAFGVFYVLACIPLGRLVDRHPRRLVLAACMAFFSLFAMASGLVRSYAQLFLMRIGVGIGEASVTPAAFSMLSDSFPPQRLGRPIGVFLMSAPFGQGLTLIAGGGLLQWLSTSDVLRSGPFSGLDPWQVAFILIGFPGLLLVPALLLLREPPRRAAANAKPLSVSEVMQVIRDRGAALLPLFMGFALVMVVLNAMALWTPATLERTYGLDKAQQGLAYGLLLLVCGTAGAFFSGWFADRLAQRGAQDAPLKVAGYSFLGCGVLTVAAVLMPSVELMLLCLAPAVFLSTMPVPATGTAIQLIVPSLARGQVSALYIMWSSLVGVLLGPVLVGLLNDLDLPIRYSMAIVVGMPVPVMFWLYMRARRPYCALRAAGAAG
ncbi:MAG: hypothetical protein RL026_2277 [Pseudomonadota bacterium]